MIFTVALNALGWMLNLLPKPVVAGLVAALGDLLYYLHFKRRRLVVSNLYHGIPGKTQQWYRKTARLTFRRTIEMGLLPIAAKFFSGKKILKYFNISSDTQSQAMELLQSSRPALLLIPHFCLCEAARFYPELLKQRLPQNALRDVHLIYRPPDHPELHTYLQRARARPGVQFVPRKQGFRGMLKVLTNGGKVGLLFDQHAGANGALSLFMDRVVSSSPFVDYFTQKSEAMPYILHAERTAFWEARLNLVPLSPGPSALLTAQTWLETRLRSSETDCQAWLWLHNRWKVHTEPTQRFNLNTKHNLLPEALQYYNYPRLPRKTVAFVRLPNWLGDILMALPVLRVLRESRPDFHITVLAKAHFIPLLENLECIDAVIPLQHTGVAHLLECWQLRKQHPHLHIVFTHSLRGDLEALLMGAPERFGVARKQSIRPLLSRIWKVPAKLETRTTHQTYLWEAFFQHFGLSVPLKLSPLVIPGLAPTARTGISIGLICGAENNPEKRWLIPYWRNLIQLLSAAYPKLRFYLLGTSTDRAITNQIAHGLPEERIFNLAGMTDLIAFAERLLHCQCVIGNDTGGLHLANALGIPAIGLYGPTNPLRTGLIYAAPNLIVQPPNTPASGGGRMSAITPEAVLEATSNFLKKALRASP